MTNDLITPPPELIARWKNNWLDAKIKHINLEDYILAQAAQWGADQELESCCEWFVRDWTDVQTADRLRAARRPKLPSLKEQALEALQSMRIDPVLIEGINVNADLRAKYKIILCALEQLDD